MKKIIYGILILIGGVLITSNFLVDSSKLDHKKVSASGTVCKWISESGYGVGPYYMDTNNNNIRQTNDSYVWINGASDLSREIFNIIPCNSDSSGNKKDGNLLYNENYELYNGYFGYKYFMIAGNAADKYGIVRVENGKLLEYKTVSSPSDGIKLGSLSNELTTNIFHNLYTIDFYSDEQFSSYVGNDFYVNYDFDGSDDIWTFTCVCAEY